MCTSTLPTTLALFGMPGGWEWIVVLVLGVLIFGRRLPEVGRSVGRGIVEFKKGLKGIDDDIEDATERPSATQSAPSMPSAQQPGGTLPGGNMADAGPTNTGTPVGSTTGSTSGS